MQPFDDSPDAPDPLIGLPGYAELQCQSNFSFLQGASHPEELAARAAELGYAALAITDECSLAGVCLLYTSPSPRDQRGSRMPSSA